MKILLLNLFVVYVASIFARLNVKEKTFESNYKNYNNIFILISLVSLIVISGFRYKSGTDFHTYTEIYMLAPKTNLSDATDIGFLIICKILNRISLDPQLMFLVTSIIINILIVNTLRKKSTSYELSMWLYINTFAYYSTFNGVRQWVAAAIVFSGSEYLFKRNFKKYLIVVILASLIHASAIVMLVIYFIVNSKPFSLRNLFIIISFIGAIFLYIPFVNLLFKLLQGTQYAYYFNVVKDSTNGVNPIRIIVYLLPVILFALFYKKLNKKKDKEIDIIFNLCIIGSLIMLLSVKQVFFARLIFYFDVYYLLLIPRLVTIGSKKFNRLIYYFIVICYFLFSYTLLTYGEARILPYEFKISIF